eukprot:118767-Pelagomonas_calceolata.AAC.3
MVLAAVPSHALLCPVMLPAALQTETIKWYVFAVFAMAFFVARIAMAPIAIVWPALTQSTKVGPASLFFCMYKTLQWANAKLSLRWFSR